MLLTTPLVVSVGLTMTIPLSLIGQMIISEQYSSALYWVGAVVVLLSFLFINHESQEEDHVATREVDRMEIAWLNSALPVSRSYRFLIRMGLLESGVCVPCLQVNDGEPHIWSFVTMVLSVANRSFRHCWPSQLCRRMVLYLDAKEIRCWGIDRKSLSAVNYVLEMGSSLP